jgi:hypothetical protein
VTRLLWAHGLLLCMLDYNDDDYYYYCLVGDISLDGDLSTCDGPGLRGHP